MADMKAILCRHIGTMGNEYKKTTMAEDAGSLAVEGGEGVVVVKKTDGSVLAVVKLGEHDYVTLE
jgi:hypothetical protein